MNTKYLEEFLVFAEELNYSSAAKRLYVTRPTLREHIAELEHDLQASLVTRKAGALVLTAAGKRFLKSARKIVDLVDETQKEYREVGEHLLTVAIGTANLCWLEGIIYKARKRIAESHPYKSFEIITTSSPSTSLQTLEDGTSDITIVGFKRYREGPAALTLPEGVQAFKLRTEEIMLLVHSGHPLFEKEHVGLADIDGHTFMLPPDIYEGYVRDKVVEYYAAKGAHIAIETGPFNDYYEYNAFEFTEKIGIVPCCLVSRFGLDERDDAKILSLTDVPLYSDFYVAYNDEFVADENARIFIGELKQLAEELYR